MAKRGRPTAYTPEIAARVLDELKAGKTLRAACRVDGLPPEGTVREWITRDENGFSAQYVEARATGYHCMADELLEIADSENNDPQRDRLRLDTRKWLLSKALPKIYGDKLDVNATGEITIKLESDATKL